MPARGARRGLALAALLAGACDDGGDGATAPPAACDRNSVGPHLHVDVTRCPAVGCPTYPVVFRNTAPHPAGLIAGETYGALP